MMQLLARPVDTARGLLVAILGVALLSAVTAQAQVIAIVGGTVHTQGEQGTLTEATVLVRDGRIVEVGRNVTVSEEARRAWGVSRPGWKRISWSGTVIRWR